MSGWRHPNNLRAGLIAGVVVLAASFPGCSKRAPEAANAPAEKVLRISQRNEPATLDPQLATLPDEFFIIRALSEGLLVPNPEGGAPLPGLAEKWEVSPDGLTYTFHLRPNAKWSNGEPVTSAEFAGMIRKATAPGSLAPKAAVFSPVHHADTPDAHTVVITLKQPVVDFPAMVASGPWIPAHAAAGLEKIGNGPFLFTEWKPNQHILVRKNPHYWDAANVKVDGVRFMAFDSGDTEERAFRAGQVDVTMSVPFSKLASYRAEQPALIRTALLHETRYIAFNVNRPPLNDVRVRRALALAIDRATLVEKVVLSGEPAFNFVPAGLGGYVPGQTMPRTVSSEASAKEEARRLLAEAGFPEGRGFPKLELTAWPVNVAQLEAIQQMWRRELGIEVTIIQREGRTHVAGVVAGDYTLALMFAIPDYDGASDLFNQLTSGHPLNYPHWSNPEFDRLVARAGALADPAARNAAYQQAEALVLREMPVVPLYFNAQNFLISPRVRGWQADRLWTRFYRQLSVD